MRAPRRGGTEPSGRSQQRLSACTEAGRQISAPERAAGSLVIVAHEGTGHHSIIAPGAHEHGTGHPEAIAQVSIAPSRSVGGSYTVVPRAVIKSVGRHSELDSPCY